MFFNFKKPEHYGLKVFIWIFIVAMNLIVMILDEPLKEIGYRGWAFWLVNISFFLMEEPDLKKKIVSIVCGAVTGCILAYLTLKLYTGYLTGLGHIGLIIPVGLSLALVILCGPFFPAFFNTVTFMYFLAALIVPADAVTNVWTNCMWAILGAIIVNGGCILIIKQYRKAQIKKLQSQA
ncbi:MAG: hypothetical protein IJQ02_08705 [Oscillospiraceae bacterium]|nr:hypothetical protein [Oscillospiraceae bacterium]